MVLGGAASGSHLKTKLEKYKKHKARKEREDPDGAYDSYFVAFALGVFVTLFWWFTTLDSAGFQASIHGETEL